MSLHYIVDGCNVMHHPLVARMQQARHNPWGCLLSLVAVKKLSGSTNNHVTVVFDGYYPTAVTLDPTPSFIRVLFSDDDSADERIFRLVETVPNAACVRVVTADKEVIFFCKAHGVQSIAPDDFLAPLSDYDNKSAARSRDQRKIELSYGQKEEINRELKEKWLKKK